MTRHVYVYTKERIIAFEKRVAEAFEAKQIKGPVHLSGGNEDALIRHFQNIAPYEWVFSTYRSHYHALLHGISEEWLFEEIVAGRSMCISNVEHKFHSSAIVGGCLPIAVGVAAALKRQGKHQKEMVHCFVGDMAARSGAFHEALQYAKGHWLPIKFYVENNGLSCDTPTAETWGTETPPGYRDGHDYTRTYPHAGIGKYVF